MYRPEHGRAFHGRHRLMLKKRLEVHKARIAAVMALILGLAALAHGN